MSGFLKGVLFLFLFIFGYLFVKALKIYKALKGAKKSGISDLQEEIRKKEKFKDMDDAEFTEINSSKNDKE